MRRYIILATAVLAAILVMSLIKAWQARRAKARGEEVKSGAGIGLEHIAGALVGLAVFFAGVVFSKATHQTWHEISAGAAENRQISSVSPAKVQRDFVTKVFPISPLARRILPLRGSRRFGADCWWCGARLASGQIDG